MDFFQISTKEVKGGVVEVYPDFTVGRCKDLMVRSRSFYAIWDENGDNGRGIWSTDEYDVQRLVDEKLAEYAKKQTEKGVSCNVKYLRSYGSNGWNQFRKYMYNIADNSHQLDQNLTFADTVVKKTDYVSRRLPYALAPGNHSTWDKLLGKLYSPDERAKIEWTIGSIVSGDSKKIQKFLVLYGPGGTGKSTVLNIVQKLFDGYIAMFEAKALVGNNNSFSTAAFKSNPLVAIQHDGDLSKIADNTTLNSIVSHETMLVNEKFKPGYEIRVNAMLLMGTNKPVKITDAKSGIIRRLIDAHPTGDLFTANQYNTHMSKIDFELGAIAHHCLEVYREMGKNFYNTYRPLEMMLQTDVFYNFIEANYDIFKEQNGAALKQAYALYKEFCAETEVPFTLPMYKFREELRNYFDKFEDRTVVNDITVRSYYSGFNSQPFKVPNSKEEPKVSSLVLDEAVSLLDQMFYDQPAQYAKTDGTPRKYWTDAERMIDGEMRKPKPSQVVDSILSDLDTSREHYTKVTPNHIVVDFDLVDEKGNKSLERNLEAASSWPSTYAEVSKSGEAIHLHYDYDGDVGQLARAYAPGIEIKVYSGDGALRRKLTRCNNIPVAKINSGLPLKEKKSMQAGTTIQSEKGLRDLITRNLRKEIHPGTKPSFEFIVKILEDAYREGLVYDVTDMRTKIVLFANNSSNHAPKLLEMIPTMKLKSKEESMPYEAPVDDPIAVFDVEVYPNLFVVCWSYVGSPTVVKMINPTALEIGELLKLKLVGFYNRNYDNHILWAAYMGYTNEELFQLSQKLIDDEVNNKVRFGEAYGISYVDIYEMSSVKMSLKKFQILLGLTHMEMDIPWDQPVPKELWGKVVDYCSNDVLTTKEVLKYRNSDLIARQILAELSGLSVNDTTNRHTAKIIFGSERNPQRYFEYTDLRTLFPTYKYEKGVSTYQPDPDKPAEIVGEGGYVFARHGMYEDVALLDVASMHPTSIEQLDLFGPYTRAFSELKTARLAIKRKDYEAAKHLLGGRLAKYLDGDEVLVKGLSDALKLAINQVYGLTSANFDNPFRDFRNKDNIVAKRGALFMMELRHFVESRGFIAAHIKTDSIKIPNATAEIITEVMNFGKKYGYEFEYDPKKDHYDKLCLVNDAVYIARNDIPATIESNNEKAWVRKWEAVGAQFQHPYVYKTLFTKEKLEFRDFCETKQVGQGHIYIDFDSAKPMFKVDDAEPKMHFIGRTGLFVPVKDGYGGGILYRVKDGKKYLVTGTKGYLWLEAEVARELGEEAIDMTYFEKLAREAEEKIDFYGPFAEFVR